MKHLAQAIITLSLALSGATLAFAGSIPLATGNAAVDYGSTLSVQVINAGDDGNGGSGKGSGDKSDKGDKKK